LHSEFIKTGGEGSGNRDQGTGIREHKLGEVREPAGGAHPFYAARFGVEGLPPAIANALKLPTAATRIGGSANILAGAPRI
jgi:hypothetical protein